MDLRETGAAIDQFVPAGKVRMLLVRIGKIADPSNQSFPIEPVRSGYSRGIRVGPP